MKLALYGLHFVKEFTNYLKLRTSPDLRQVAKSTGNAETRDGEFFEGQRAARDYASKDRRASKSVLVRPTLESVKTTVLR